MVLPCGVGLPHCQPDWLTCTAASLVCEHAAARLRAAKAPRKALVLKVLLLSIATVFKNGIERQVLRLRSREEKSRVAIGRHSGKALRPSALRVEVRELA